MAKNFFNYTINSFYSNKNNSKLLSKSIRVCIIGKSECGKTNLLMNLLLQDQLDLFIHFSTTLY